ncbi:MAG: mechanosensitive ion channel family protein [Verrucomicrobia bacterium]|nr:mechanosensitive ion channel family protein [Verrucomicrobiota bacterium]
METNNFLDCLQFLFFILAGFIGGRFVKYFCEQASSKVKVGQTSLRRASLLLAGRTATFPVMLIGVCLALHSIVIPADLQGTLGDVTAVLITIGVTYVIYQMAGLVNHWLRHLTSKAQTTLDDMMVPMVRKTLRVITVILGLVQIAQQLSDKPITSILAGLGVGGLAIALAAQDTIKNFFGSLVIFGDHPFQLGDRIVVEAIDGTVEEVGMRSTRIRTLDGHLVTIPNGDLANKSIRNISRRPYIKRTANLMIACDTPAEKVERAILIIKEELTRAKEKMHPDFPPQVYFNEITVTSLNLLVTYWFAPPDYAAFSEFDQAFNLAVLRRFCEEGIEFAAPALAGRPNRSS